MRGTIELNGKKMTVTELVEAYLETKNDLDTANKLLKSRTDEIFALKNSVSNLEDKLAKTTGRFNHLKTRCIPGSDIAFANYKFGDLTIVLNSDYDKLVKEIEALEFELRVKEDLLTIKDAISNEPTEEHSERPSIEWYEQRYQSDCITINQLHTTIDVLADKLSRLREVKGL